MSLNKELLSPREERRKAGHLPKTLLASLGYCNPMTFLVFLFLFPTAFIYVFGGSEWSAKLTYSDGFTC